MSAVTSPAPASATPSPTAPAAALGALRHGLTLALCGLAVWWVWTVPTGLSDQARIAIIVLTLAIIGWTLTRISDTTVALTGAIALVAAGVVPQQALHEALGSGLIWLLIGAFVLAAVLKASGLTEVLAIRLVRRFSTPRALFHAVTAFLVMTALFIPSTSGRAALALPVFLAIADKLAGEATHGRALTRALALLFPTVILVSAGGSLIGAGAHLIAVDFIRLLGGPSFDYLGWLILGMPLAILISVAATELILALFLTRAERAARLDLGSLQARPLQRQDALLIALVLATVGLWLTNAWHGLGVAIVTLIAALVATSPIVSQTPLKKAVKSVEWDLLLFMAATLLIGEALLQTNAEEWAARRIVMAMGGAGALSVGVIVLSVIALSLLAHLVITSRTARVTVLIPTLAIPLSGLGVDPTALIMICVMGTGFCQTLPASAKPVAMYADLERETYSGPDLLKLSLALAPIMAAALALFAFIVWPMMGLSAWR
jgi:anion transporter